MKSVTAAVLSFLAAAVLFANLGTSEAKRVAAEPPPPAQPACLEKQQVAFDGTYDSNWGKITLHRNGNRVTGSYECCGGGRIDGTINGNVIKYRWTQPGGSGYGIWVVATSGELIGTWGVGDDVSGGGWNLRRDFSAAGAAQIQP
jgi:hypothetical protein